VDHRLHGRGLSPLVRSGRIQGRQIYQRKDGCYCDFATDIAAIEGMSGSPVITAQSEVIGILTLAGSGKFRGLSFGASLEEAANFLKNGRRADDGRSARLDRPTTRETLNTDQGFKFLQITSFDSEKHLSHYAAQWILEFVRSLMNLKATETSPGPLYREPNQTRRVSC
jgi:hypothetical protein